MTVLEAAESGSYRDLLVALRNHIARAIDDGCSPRDLVGLSRRLSEFAAELRALDAAAAVTLRVVSDEPFDPAAV